MNNNTIQVMVVDDSVVVRGLLTKALQTDPGIIVSGSAGNGSSALSILRKQSFDAVVMDVEMPILDGLETLKILQKEFPKLPVIMASTLTTRGAAITIQALANGASGCIEKPQASSASEAMKIVADQLIPLVKSLCPQKAKALVATTSPSTITSAGSVTQASSRATRLATNFSSLRAQAVVIGSSTGGPQALSRVMKALSEKMTLPIFIVQHMPAAFTPMLAEHITRDARRPAQEAKDGEVVQAGRIYIAPGNYHMYLEKRGMQVLTRLNQAEQEHYCRPSVNPLYRSASEIYGNRLLAVMLTGMGEDGIEGAHDLVAKGGYMIAQDEASSVVWGMPGTIVRADLASEVLSIEEIPRKINQLCPQEVCHV
ncbi:chemotaxis-specific protein-glutamate methyltransferase CheB [Lacunimicrobium album]